MSDGRITPADLSDDELRRLRAEVTAELKRRGLASSVAEVAEGLALSFFNGTAGRPNLQAAPVNTQNVDALSRRGDRYSIKGVMDARKTGTVYPDRDDPEKQLFEYLLVVCVDREWRLQAIYEFDWATFREVRSWDSRMSAWYVGLAARTLDRANLYLPPDVDRLLERPRRALRKSAGGGSTS